MIHIAMSLHLHSAKKAVRFSPLFSTDYATDDL